MPNCFKETENSIYQVSLKEFDPRSVPCFQLKFTVEFYTSDKVISKHYEAHFRWRHSTPSGKLASGEMDFEKCTYIG